PQPDWFRSNLDFGKVGYGLRAAGFGAEDVDGILGRNWHDFFKRSFEAPVKTENRFPASEAISLRA
ncbi:MAG: hypothetical protein ABWY00_06575, partial [Dongiaceae bacterium]